MKGIAGSIRGDIRKKLFTQRLLPVCNSLPKLELQTQSPGLTPSAAASGAEMLPAGNRGLGAA